MESIVLKKTPLLRRTPFRSKRPPREPSEPFAASAPMTVAQSDVRPVAGHTAPSSVTPEPVQKRAVVESPALRDSARGEACTLQIPGVCSHDWSTTILAHLPSDIAGTKATDVSSCYSDFACHDAVDRRVISEEFEQSRDWYLRRAMVRTLTRMIDKGLLSFVGQAK